LSVQCYSICLDADPLDAGPGDANDVARFGPSQDFRDVLSAIAIHHSHVRGGIACPGRQGFGNERQWDEKWQNCYFFENFELS
jgi:hypothetical protein